MLKRFCKQISVFVFIFFIGISAALAAEGVTDKVVHIGQTGPLSGPAKIWETMIPGAALRIALENENDGVYGRKIEHHVYDDAYNPARTKIGVKQLQESLGIFAWIGGVGTSNGLAVKDYLMNRKIPWFGPFSGSSIWFDPPEKYLFAIFPPYTFEVEVLCDYAVKQLKKKRIAIVYQDDGYGQNGLKGAQATLKKYNLPLVAATPIKLSDVNMTPAAVKLYQVKADAVLMWMSPFSALQLMKAAENMNYAPQWMASSTLSMFPTFHQISRGLVEGLITANYVTDDQAVLDYYRKAHDRLDPDQPFNTAYLLGISVADALIEGMRRCGPNLTRDGLVKALETIKANNFSTTTKGLSFAPFDPNDPMCRLGTRQIFLQQCLANGTGKKVTGWVTVQY